MRVRRCIFSCGGIARSGAKTGSPSDIANLNHVPEPLRDVELKEAYRCLKPGGNIIVTMVSGLVGGLTHWEVHAYDKLFGTNHDMDGERGMHEHEAFHLGDSEIKERLRARGISRRSEEIFPDPVVSQSPFRWMEKLRRMFL